METEAEMVNKRSAELLDEFLEHWRQAQEREGHAVNREEACCGWLLQKVAGLQVAVDLRADLASMRLGCDSRQRSIELLGLAIGTIIPDFRASGSSEQHSAAAAKALVAEGEKLRADLAATKAKLSEAVGVLRDVQISADKAARAECDMKQPHICDVGWLEIVEVKRLVRGALARLTKEQEKP